MENISKVVCCIIMVLLLNNCGTTSIDQSGAKMQSSIYSIKNVIADSQLKSNLRKECEDDCWSKYIGDSNKMIQKRIRCFCDCSKKHNYKSYDAGCN